QLAVFRDENARTVAAGLDPDGGEQEAGLLVQLDKQLTLLDTAVKIARTRTNREYTVQLRNDPEVRAAHEKAKLTAEHLRLAIVDDIQASGRHSNAAIRQSLWVVGFATIWAIVLVVTML